MLKFAVLAYFLFAAPPPEPSRESIQSCVAAEQEQRILQRRLTDADWQVFTRVATDRMGRGLDALPCLLCPIPDVAAELVNDARTVSLLRELRRSPEDYAEISWAVLVALDPGSFNLRPDTVIADNMRLLASRRSEVDRIFFRDD